MAIEDWGIGVVGLGDIAFQHLEGYRRQGLSVAGGMDIDRSRARTAKERFDLPWVTSDIEEIIAHPSVRVVDVTVPHRLDIRLPVVEAAARHGKALFIQKPLLPYLKDAKRLVEVAEEAGVPLMVNQNSLFAPQFLALEPCLPDIKTPAGKAEASDRSDPIPTSPTIGDPYYFQIDNRSWSDLSGHPWFGKSERWVNSDMAIHHYALVRHWFGDAESVSALLTKDPGQSGIIGETGSSIMIRFKSGVCGLVINNWSYRGPHSHPHPSEEVIIQGNQGTVTANADEVVVARADGEERIPVEGTWFPDAFGHSMAHFIHALDTRTPFLCSGADNLKTLAIVEAAYRSASEKREVTLEEVLSESEEAA